ncbi:hypothetical protein GOP47_0024178 [Adiantum capillus-veneris]|uniref:BHLH domain-containing protein n=1 Tax=Adiantum capillus-veneris TaxID=13818 RepID=A0A9D4Z419_ADICA|nr:hypothetical protein GOP47_0024178 [Adiantum capillus-veneris]
MESSTVPLLQQAFPCWASHSMLADNLSMVHHIPQYAGDLPYMASSTTSFLSNIYAGEEANYYISKQLAGLRQARGIEGEAAEEDQLEGGEEEVAAATETAVCNGRGNCGLGYASSPAAAEAALPLPLAAPCGSLQVPLSSHFSINNGLFSSCMRPCLPSDENHITSALPIRAADASLPHMHSHELKYTCSPSFSTHCYSTLSGNSRSCPRSPPSPAATSAFSTSITSPQENIVHLPYIINNSIYLDPILCLENSFSPLAPNVMIQPHPAADPPPAATCPPPDFHVPSFSSSLCVPEMIGAAGHQQLAQYTENLLASHRNPVDNTLAQLSSHSCAPYKRYKASFPCATSIGLSSLPPSLNTSDLLALKEPISTANFLHYSTPKAISPPPQGHHERNQINASKGTIHGQLNVIAEGKWGNTGVHLGTPRADYSSLNMFPTLETDPCQQPLVAHNNEQTRLVVNSSRLYDQKEDHHALFNQSFSQEFPTPFQERAVADTTAICVEQTGATLGIVPQALHESERASSSGSTKLCGSNGGDQDGIGDGQHSYGIMNYASSSPNAGSPVDIYPISASNQCNEAENNRLSAKPGEKSNAKLQRNKVSVHPQGVAARRRRHRISNKFKILQTLVPGGTKMDTASMLDEAIEYIKYLRHQIWLHQLLEVSQMINSGEGDRPINSSHSQLPPPAPTCTNSTIDFPAATIPPCSNSFFWPNAFNI